MSTIRDLIGLINELSSDNVRLAQHGKQLLEENLKLKAECERISNEPDPVGRNDPPRP